MKINKTSEFYVIFAQKIIKMPESFMISAGKMPKFYMIIFFLGGGTYPPSYAATSTLNKLLTLECLVGERDVNSVLQADRNRCNCRKSLP